MCMEMKVREVREGLQALRSTDDKTLSGRGCTANILPRTLLRISRQENSDTKTKTQNGRLLSHQSSFNMQTKFWTRLLLQKTTDYQENECTWTLVQFGRIQLQADHPPEAQKDPKIVQGRPGPSVRMIGSNNGVPDTKYLLTKELTLEDAAWRTQLPSSQDRTDNVGPIGFIFKEGEVLCMKCRKKFRCQTTEKKVVYDCHAKSAGGHQEAPESDTYVIQIVGKEVFIPNKVGFDREGIVKSAVPVPDPEGSNVADLVGIRHITSSIVTSRQSTGTMPGTSGPPSPTLKPSASSSAKPKPTSSSKTPRKQKFKILSKRAKKPEADDDRESDLEVVAIVNNSSGAITRRNGDDSDDSTSSIELIEIVPRESSR